jgi:hypothetical protein
MTKSNGVATRMIEVTDRAREALTTILAQRGSSSIRLYMDGFG